MEKEQIIASIQTLVEQVIAENPDYFLVEIKIKPTNNVKVYLDADNGAAISKLVSFNRALYALLEPSGIFPNDDFSLEVSSPGLDEPLKNQRQFRKNIGRKVEVTLLDGAAKEGKLLAADEEKVTIEELIGKKKEQKITDINFSEIKHTHVCIVF
ncbi:ribosome maturation factor [Chitinophaga sedimenti]|uniref:ribosome maturation factor RimP n=1 Tax=Chitinophaga sedimenti TaxID=2033606 RepID=UPI002003D088|nr:ribosome maturation factor [Chitinophaga sedimenti]MCK7558519.1 ribosome maturation factor [Chitinophaga sedimenti]